MESFSSRESSPSDSSTSAEAQHSAPNASHLAALEKLLQASLGAQFAQYGTDTAPAPLELISLDPAIDSGLSDTPEQLVVEETPLEDEIVGAAGFNPHCTEQWIKPILH